MRKKRKSNKTRSDTSTKKRKSVKRKRTIGRKQLPKTRADGSMTEVEFWQLIRSALRQKSRWWKPISFTKNKARRPYKGPNKRQRWEYQCNICKEWWRGDETFVDHIEPVGILRKNEDLPRFVDNLFCDSVNLQCVCKKCHDVKTKLDKAAMRAIKS